MLKKLSYKVLMAMIVLITLLGVIPQQMASTAVEPTNNFDPAIEALISQATLQITIIPADGSGAAPGETVAEQGLGTLVSLSEDVMILTHNHWHFIKNPLKARFHNTRGELLLEIDGRAFQDLIRFRDAGTLVLAAPVELRPDNLAVLAARAQIKAEQITATAVLGQVQKMEVGAQVLVSHQSSQDPNRVSLLTAVVEQLISEDGLPALKLRSLDGEVIVQGDSGGGIWLGGQLVGNMWKYEYLPDWRILTFGLLQPGIRFTDISYAALLPVEYQSLADSVQSPRSGAGQDRPICIHIYTACR